MRVGRLLEPRVALLAVVALALACRVAWLSVPPDSLIFDESYYVNAARVILGWPVPPGAPYADQPAGLDPNREHPPLGKLYMAASMAILGDNPLGWRLPSELAGLASVLLVYGIVRAAGGHGWLGVLAAALYAFDNLALVHSRIATLDMLLVAFLLLGAWLAVRGWEVLAGLALGLAALVKIGGVYGLLAVLAYEGLLAVRDWRLERRRPWQRLRAASLLAVAFLPLWLDGLWLLDQRLTVFAAPWDHLRYMLEYGLSLSRTAGPANIESYPWQWLLNDVQIPYLRVDEQVASNGQVTEVRPTIFFRGAMNPILIGSAPLGLAYVAWRCVVRLDRVSLWAAAWVIGTYLPFYPLAMAAGRISYLFYFLPTLPAVAISLAVLLYCGGLPRWVLWGYVLAVLLGFAGYFPFRRLPP